MRSTERRIEMLSEKPNYLLATEKLGLIFPIFWCVVALAVGIAIDQVNGAIFISFGSLAMVWMCLKISSFFLSFQN